MMMPVWVLLWTFVALVHDLSGGVGTSPDAPQQWGREAQVQLTAPWQLLLGLHGQAQTTALEAWKKFLP